MKKCLSLLLGAAMVLMMGCGSQEAGDKVFVDPKANQQNAAVTSQKAELPDGSEPAGAEEEEGEEILSLVDSGFVSGQVQILPLEEAEGVLKRLGEPQSTFEADSCAYQGKDYYYYYFGYELTVNELEGVRVITAVTLVDDTVKAEFPTGKLGIGDTLETLLEVLGGEDGQDYYAYAGEQVRLEIQLTEGVITAMVFRPAEETAGEE